MNAIHFDAIARLFTSRKSRRAAITGGIGLASAAVTHRAFAQDGTPEVATPMADPHESADDAQTHPEFLFVQPFDAGTWAPKDGEDGTYTLTLTGAAAQTVYFSDRPERIVGLSPTDKFLDGLGFTPANPPNAAIVAQREGSEDHEILIIELFDPAYDAETSTLTYTARVLEDYDAPGLASLAAEQTDHELPESFADGSLFIDDCSDGSATCYQIVNNEKVIVGTINNVGCCFKVEFNFGCHHPCNDDLTSQYYGKLCNEVYPDQCIYGTSSGSFGWTCFAENVSC